MSDTSKETSSITRTKEVNFETLAANLSSQESLKETSYTIEIKPLGSGWDFNLKEIWAYRELLYFLVWRDIKIRYKQTVLGALWALLQPLLTMAVFTVLFGKLAGIKTDDIPYPLFAFCGLVIWTFINTTVNSSSNSLVNNTNLITKIYFPRLLIPYSAVVAGLIDVLLSLIVLVVIMILYSQAFHLSMLLAPCFLLLAVLLAVGVGSFLSSLNVRFRDVKMLLPFGLQLWMFISPVFYPLSLFPEKWRWALALNPLTGILEGFRSSLFGKPFDYFSLVSSIVLTTLLFFVGAVIFKKMEDDFADYL